MMTKNSKHTLAQIIEACGKVAREHIDVSLDEFRDLVDRQLTEDDEARRKQTQ